MPTAISPNYLTQPKSSKGQPSTILLTVTPTPGHVNPMLAIACHLRDHGYSIIFNTAEVFRKEVESKGLRFVRLKGKANFDYRTFNKFRPESQTSTPGPEELIHDIRHVFGDTMILSATESRRS